MTTKNVNSDPKEVFLGDNINDITLEDFFASIKELFVRSREEGESFRPTIRVYDTDDIHRADVALRPLEDEFDVNNCITEAMSLALLYNGMRIIYVFDASTESEEGFGNEVDFINVVAINGNERMIAVAVFPYKILDDGSISWLPNDIITNLEAIYEVIDPMLLMNLATSLTGTRYHYDYDSNIMVELLTQKGHLINVYT